jgi:hypothetical protein
VEGREGGICGRVDDVVVSAVLPCLFGLPGVFSGPLSPCASYASSGSSERSPKRSKGL